MHAFIRWWLRINFQIIHSLPITTDGGGPVQPDHPFSISQSSIARAGFHYWLDQFLQYYRYQLISSHRMIIATPPAEYLSSLRLEIRPNFVGCFILWKHFLTTERSLVVVGRSVDRCKYAWCTQHLVYRSINLWQCEKSPCLGELLVASRDAAWGKVPLGPGNKCFINWTKLPSLNEHIPDSSAVCILVVWKELSCWNFIRLNLQWAYQFIMQGLIESGHSVGFAIKTLLSGSVRKVWVIINDGFI